jgi:hypothetical protein
MRLVEGTAVFSPSDLTGYLYCDHLLTREVTGNGWRVDSARARRCMAARPAVEYLVSLGSSYTQCATDGVGPGGATEAVSGLDAIDATRAINRTASSMTTVPGRNGARASFLVMYSRGIVPRCVVQRPDKFENLCELQRPSAYRATSGR